MTATLVVSLHDVAPASASATRWWLEVLAPLPIPLTFLLIPGPWREASFEDRGDDGEYVSGWLRTRQEQGDEMSLHGWLHRADTTGPWPRRVVGSVVARGAAEFWALDRAAAGRRACQGLEVLDRNGLRIDGTTPPGWLAGRAAVAGFADAGLGYVTDHAGLVELGSGRRWRAPALCHRPGPPSAARAPIGEATGRRLLAASWRLVAAGRSIRIALHPDDLARPGLAEAAVRAISRSLDAGAEAITYREAARRLRTTIPDATTRSATGSEPGR